MPSPLDRKYLSFGLIALALIVTAALRPGGAGAAAADPGPRATTHRLVVPAAAFAPAYNGIEFVNSGDDLVSLSTFAGCLAPVQFPHPVVTVKEITLYAYDNGTLKVWVDLFRSRPAAGSSGVVARAESAGQSTTDPRAFTGVATQRAAIDTGQRGVYLSLYLPPGIDYKFYGVIIRYEA